MKPVRVAGNFEVGAKKVQNTESSMRDEIATPAKAIGAGRNQISREDFAGKAYNPGDIRISPYLDT
jgi:hypothetical protein